MAESTALVTVVSGKEYKRMAAEMFESAERFFKPTETVEFVTLPAFLGWPDATMFRPARLLEHLPAADYIYLIDADMVVNDVGPEILPPRPLGITATLHPGYVGKPRGELPYERNPDSECYVSDDVGEVYYCGGFWGGAIAGVALLCEKIARLIELDANYGVTPAHHDESALNAVLATSPPDVTLHPGFCDPADDSWYRSWWPEQWPRKITALDKSAEVRAARA